MQRQCLSSGPRCQRCPAQRQPTARQRRCQVHAMAAAQQPGAATRRQLLSAGTALAGGLLLAQPLPAHAGMERYVKKKQLDPLDTYVPLVLEARQRLAGLNDVAAEAPSAARGALRTGAFNGLRDNIRAVGQYAAAPPAGGSAAGALTEQQADALVTSFFRALEDYDLLLYNAVREQQEQERKAAKAAKDGGSDAGEGSSISVSLDADAAATKLAAAVARLDELIATVPADVLARSRAVLAKVSGSSS